MAIFCHVSIQLYVIQIYSVVKITLPDNAFVDLTLVPSAERSRLLSFTGGVFGRSLAAASSCGALSLTRCRWQQISFLQAKMQIPALSKLARWRVTTLFRNKTQMLYQAHPWERAEGGEECKTEVRPSCRRRGKGENLGAGVDC